MIQCLSGRVQSRQLPRGGGHQQQHGLHLEEDWRGDWPAGLIITRSGVVFIIIYIFICECFIPMWVCHVCIFEKFIESNHLFHPASVAVVSCDHQTYFCSLLKQILIEKLNQDTKNKSNPVNKKRKLKPVAQESVKYS